MDIHNFVIFAHGYCCGGSSVFYYEINGQAKYMTTGAGGMVIIGGEDGVYRNRHTNASSATAAAKSLWSKVVTGFSSHTFTDGGKTLRTEFWDVKKNETIYEFEVHL